MSFQVDIDGEELFIRAKTIGPHEFLNNTFIGTYSNVQKIVTTQLPDKLKTAGARKKYMNMIAADAYAEAARDHGNAGVQFVRLYQAMVKVYTAECFNIPRDTFDKSSNRRALFQYKLSVTLEDKIIWIISNFPNYDAYLKWQITGSNIG